MENNYIFDIQKEKIDIKTLHHWLKECYWCKNIPLNIVQKAIQNSLCAAIFFNDEIIGFARVITDKCTFAYK